MKIEDMKFPIEVEIKDEGKEYKISFDGYPWIIFGCCGCKKIISGNIKSRKIPKLIKGFKFNKDMERWSCIYGFRFCPICGKEVWDERGIYIDIIRKAWLKVVNKR